MGLFDEDDDLVVLSDSIPNDTVFTVKLQVSKVSCEQPCPPYGYNEVWRDMSDGSAYSRYQMMS